MKKKKDFKDVFLELLGLMWLLLWVCKFWTINDKS